MKVLGSRIEAGRWRALSLLLLAACATRELPASHDQRSALSPKAKPGAVPSVTQSLDAQPGEGAAETPAHPHHEHQQHGGHHHGH